MKKPSIDLSGLNSQFEGVSAKVATVLRHVDRTQIAGLVQNKAPEVGDVLLAKVTSVGDKDTLQSPDGRNVELHEGDKILVAYGNRYAVEEYKAMVPEKLTECHLVSSGGVAALIEETNDVMKSPTVIKPIGLLADENDRVMNIKHSAMRPLEIDAKSRPTTIAVLGTGMDAGKTTSASALVKGMERAGHKVGFGKMTGTGLSSDIHKPQDAGAIAVCDFVDMGYPSTYKVETDDLINVLQGITTNLSLRGTDVNIIEIADGVLQSDNKKLLRSDQFKSQIDGVLLAADSGLSALYAAEKLSEHGIPVLALSGRMMLAPLAVKEFENNVSSDAKPVFGVLGLEDLRKQGNANKMMNFIQEHSPDEAPAIEQPASSNENAAEP
ncbi:MAG: DUF1611 domain-containing protein [Alphaproteobacteria bacterium]